MANTKHLSFGLPTPNGKVIALPLPVLCKMSKDESNIKPAHRQWL